MSVLCRHCEAKLQGALTKEQMRQLHALMDVVQAQLDRKPKADPYWAVMPPVVKA